MAYQFDGFQKFGKEQLEVVTTSSSSLAKGWQTIAAESSEYSKKSFENGSAFFEKLLGAKSFESAIQIQGISKLARVVQGFARRLQIQEKLTAAIAEAIQDILEPQA